MALEIERKFLVTAPPASISEQEGTRIEQGYLAIADAVEVRLRRADSATLMTVKGGHGDVREEVEFALDPGVFATLWPLTEGSRLRKTRRRVPLEGGLSAEVDFFKDGLDGLVVAEVEFGDETAERGFGPPSWFGEELTGDGRYAGQSLATKGLPNSGPGGAESDGGGPFRLKRKESVVAGTRRIATGRAERALGRLEGADADRDAAVHGVRKDLKKLRAVLRLVRDGLGEGFYKEQNRRFRDAGRLLSDLRDAEVKIATLEALAERFDSDLPQQPASLWKGMLEGERRQATVGAGDDISARMREAEEAIAGGAEELAEWPADGHGWALVEGGLTRAYREARGEMKRARSSRSAEDVHEWRKRAKDLWYDLRLLRGAWRPAIGGLAEQAHELADLLGDHHDLTVLAEDLAGRHAVRDRRRIAELIERRQDELLDDALALGSRLFAEKPKAFRRRLRSYWRAWR